VAVAHGSGTAAGQGLAPPHRRSPWRMVASSAVTLAVLLVVFVGILPKVADYSQVWSSIRQMPTAYAVALVVATVVRGGPDGVRHQQRWPAVSSRGPTC
jgi:succinate dehydrogenase hydrophobic anchor subunit